MTAVPDHVRHWPERHRQQPQCIGCDITDPAQLRWYTCGLACLDHRPPALTFVPQPQLEEVHVPQPVKLPTGRVKLPPRRRAKRK